MTGSRREARRGRPVHSTRQRRARRRSRSQRCLRGGSRRRVCAGPQDAAARGTPWALHSWNCTSAPGAPRWWPQGRRRTRGPGPSRRRRACRWRSARRPVLNFPRFIVLLPKVRGPLLRSERAVHGNIHRSSGRGSSPGSGRSSSPGSGSLAPSSYGRSSRIANCMCRSG